MVTGSLVYYRRQNSILSLNLTENVYKSSQSILINSKGNLIEIDIRLKTMVLEKLKILHLETRQVRLKPVPNSECKSTRKMITNQRISTDTGVKMMQTNIISLMNVQLMLLK